MEIKRCLLSVFQSSILCEERAEELAVYEIEHEGETGFLRCERSIDKRDVEEELLASTETLADAVRDACPDTHGFKPEKEGDEAREALKAIEDSIECWEDASGF